MNGWWVETCESRAELARARAELEAAERAWISALHRAYRAKTRRRNRRRR